MGEAPDLFGEVVAWRAWKVIGGVSLPILSSVSHSECVWHPSRWTLATCGEQLVCRDGVRIPGEGCSCGLYAAKTRAQLVDLGYGIEGSRQVVLIGEVGLVGKVIEGEQGWRAEKGRVRKLYVPFHDYRYVEGLKKLYRVPVVLDNTQNIYPTFGREGSP